MTNLKVLGVTQTYLFGTTSQVTQIVVHNESTGLQVPITVSEEDAYMVINLAEGAQSDGEEEFGDPVSQENEAGEQI